MYKWERIHGQELTVEGVHEILVYEIGWREDRYRAQHEDAAKVRKIARRWRSTGPRQGPR